MRIEDYFVTAFLFGITALPLFTFLLAILNGLLR